MVPGGSHHAGGSVPIRHLEGCESGRIGTIGNRVWGNPPWVQIPPSPLDISRSVSRSVSRCPTLTQMGRYCGARFPPSTDHPPPLPKSHSRIVTLVGRRCTRGTRGVASIHASYPAHLARRRHLARHRCDRGVEPSLLGPSPDGLRDPFRHPGGVGLAARLVARPYRDLDAGRRDRQSDRAFTTSNARARSGCNRLPSWRPRPPSCGDRACEVSRRAPTCQGRCWLRHRRPIAHQECGPAH